MQKSQNINISSEDLLILDNQLCFALYVASKELIKKYKPLLEKLDLTYTGYITMLALWEEDNIKVKDLGEKLYLDSGTLTPLLKKLEKKNYIERVRSKADERIVYIVLTKKGRSIKEKAKPIPEQLICSTNSSMEQLMSLRDEVKVFISRLKLDDCKK